MRRFAGVELGEDRVPDETTILRFRHLLEDHQLTEAIFTEIGALLAEKRLLLKAGTIVDATIIAAPSSTKNATETRDPEMKQTKKGKQWYFGMKLHTGTDTRGLVHHVTPTATAASVGDITELPKLLHGEAHVLYGDQAYWKGDHRAHWQAEGGKYRVNQRGTKQHPLTAHQKRINRSRSRTRARGEHAYHVVKRLWGFTKVRYRGPGEESRTGADDVRAGQPVSRAPSAVAEGLYGVLGVSPGTPGRGGRHGAGAPSRTTPARSGGATRRSGCDSESYCSENSTCAELP